MWRVAHLNVFAAPFPLRRAPFLRLRSGQALAFFARVGNDTVCRLLFSAGVSGSRPSKITKDGTPGIGSTSEVEDSGLDLHKSGVPDSLPLRQAQGKL